MATSTTVAPTIVSLSPVPLTTTFTPPTFCNNPSSYQWTTHQYYTYDDAFDLERYNSLCYPSHSTQQSIPSTLDIPQWNLVQLPVFSPGICPSGYISQNLNISGPVTTAGCCQPGFSITSYGYGGLTSTWCESDTSTTSNIAFTGGYYTETEYSTSVISIRSSTTTYIIINYPTIGTTTTYIPASTGPAEVDYYYIQPAVVIQYASSDQSVFSAATASTSSAPISSTSASKPSSGLSTGAQAGIGVGVAVGGLALIGLIGFLVWFCMKKRRRAQEEAEAGMGGMGGSNVREIDQSWIGGGPGSKEWTRDTGFGVTSGPGTVGSETREIDQSWVGGRPAGKQWSTGTGSGVNSGPGAMSVSSGRESSAPGTMNPLSE